MFRVFEARSRSILSPTSGFIKQAGFTHSLTPARNCTFGCTYCYVPTMHVFAGLKREDWERWGQFTTFKANAPELLLHELRSDQVIYGSPLVDPYQPPEAQFEMMPRLLNAVLQRPPAVFVIQTRGPLITRDVELLRQVSERTRLRVSFSLTTDREDVGRLFEPHCAPLDERLEAIGALTAAGIETFATLAPLLPCDPERLIELAIAATSKDVIGDPLHVRETKRSGATTREAAHKILHHHGFAEWADPQFQSGIVERMKRAAAAQGKRFATGPEGFSWLAQT